MLGRIGKKETEERDRKIQEREKKERERKIQERDGKIQDTREIIYKKV